MKKVLLLATACMLALAGNAQTTTNYDTDRGFIHPGGLHTQADFDRIKSQLANNNSLVTRAFAVLKSSGYAKSDVQTWPVVTIKRGVQGDENYMNAARGAAMAYQNALMWKITGEKAHADAAVRVLMAWAHTTTGIGGNSNYALAAGLYGYEFAQAAELMRDYEGWNRNDFNVFKQWMLSVWYPSEIDFLRRRNGTWENSGRWWRSPGHYWSNWGLCNTLAVMSIGVLCDDVFIYNQGLSYFKYDQVGTFVDPRTANPILNNGLNEFLGNLVVTHQKSDLETGAYGELGQMQESGRDIGHAAMAGGLAVDIAHQGWNQGDDLFAYMNHRLAAGIEYLAAETQSVSNLPWTNYAYRNCGTAETDDRAWTQTGPALGKHIRPYWGTVIGIYEGVKGVKMPYSEMAYQDMIAGGPDGGGAGGTSGGYDHLGFSTLMNTYDSIAPANKVPTELQGKMLVNGDTINHNELGGLVNTYQVNNNTGVVKGTTITLMPQLPDSVADTGQWQWNTGETTRNITITANKSYVYRATYTNTNGVKSNLCFSIAVQGDCIPSSGVSLSAVVDGTTYTKDTVTAYYGSRVILNCTARANYGTFKWSTGATGSSIAVPSLTKDTTYYVDYLNQGGAATRKQIALKVKYSSLQTVVNGVVKPDTTFTACQLGDNVVMGPYVPAAYTQGVYKWQSGATTRTLTFKGITTSYEDVLHYTINGKEDSVKYGVYVQDSVRIHVTPGMYMIRNRYTGEYLTNDGGANGNAHFMPLNTSNINQQLFKLHEPQNDSIYSIQSMADSLYLGAALRPLISTRKRFWFYKAIGTNYYEIKNPLRFLEPADDGTVTYDRTQPVNFAFELVPYQDTAIRDINTNRDGNTRQARHYNLAGQRVNDSYKGVVIINGKKFINQ